MATAKGKRVTAKEVAAAYGETVEEEPKSTTPVLDSLVIGDLDICNHEVTDSKKALYQYRFGNPVLCKICGARVKLVWVTA